MDEITEDVDVIDIKSNYVTKEKYQEAMNKINKLNKYILESDNEDNTKEEETNDEPVVVKEPTGFDYNKPCSNMDYVENMLKDRELYKAKFGIDPLSGNGITDERADEIADILKQMLDVSKGNQVSFDDKLFDAIKDTAPHIKIKGIK